MFMNLKYVNYNIQSPRCSHNILLRSNRITLRQNVDMVCCMLRLKLHTENFTDQPVYCTLHNAPCTLHTAHCTLHTAHCPLHTTHYTLHTVHCTLHASHYTLITAHLPLHTTHITLLTAHCILHNEHCTLHTLVSADTPWGVGRLDTPCSAQ